MLEDITANDHVKVLDDCLFCVHLQRQYSAARELEEFLKTKNDSNADDSRAAKYFQALKVRYFIYKTFSLASLTLFVVIFFQRGSDNENKLNDSYMKKKLGQVVVFGDIIQVRDFIRFNLMSHHFAIYHFAI